MLKTVVITGGSGAIGQACGRLFLERGCNVVMGYHNNEIKGFEKYSEIGRMISVKADISVKAQAEALICAAEDKFGGIDVLVNNAAISVHGLFQYTSENELDEIIGINIKGMYFTSQYAVKSMLKNHSGCIINISSMWGETGASCEVAYSMTKSAVIGFTKSLAKELGPSGIRVNCVSPGLIDTPMNSRLSAEDISCLVSDTPLMRIGTPEDVASAVLFLSEGGSSFITGQIIGVNGGYII